jgi:hypothetical protein
MGDYSVTCFRTLCRRRRGVGGGGGGGNPDLRGHKHGRNMASFMAKSKFRGENMSSSAKHLVYSAERDVSHPYKS